MPMSTKSAAEKQQGKKIPEKKYLTKKLLKSKHLAGYQPDFAKAILKEPAYSITEAKAILESVLKGGQ